MWRGLSLLAAAEAGIGVRRRVTVYAIYAAAGLVALIGGLFLLLALQIWLMRYMTPLMAALAVAGLLILVALVLYFVGKARLNDRRAQFPLKTTALAVAPAALQAVSRKISLSTIAVVGVVALGAVLGRRMSRDADD